MTYYLDFLRELDASSNPQQTLAEMVTMVGGVVDNGPVRHALEEGAALLAAIHDWTNPSGVEVLPYYQEVCAQIETLTLRLGADLALEEKLWDGDGGDD